MGGKQGRPQPIKENLVDMKQKIPAEYAKIQQPKMPKYMPEPINVSNQLGLIIQSYCLYCYQRFDCDKRQPMLCLPCQHSFCRPCLDTAVFNHKQQGFCTECSMWLTLKDVGKNTLMCFLLQTLHKYNDLVVKTADQSEAVKKQVADKIYENYHNYYLCGNCHLNFDRFKRQPVVICNKEHILCTSCLQVSKAKKCYQCKSEYLPNLVPSRLVLRLSEFIYDIKFSHKIKVLINSMQEFTIQTNPDVEIKDIFMTLRDFGHLSHILKPEDCVFYTAAEQAAQEEQKEKDRTKVIAIKDKAKVIVNKERTKMIAKKGQKVGKNDTIYIQYGEEALKMGAKATVPSQIYKNLPIKIKSFEPLNLVKHSSKIYQNIDQQVQKYINQGFCHEVNQAGQNQKQHKQLKQYSISEQKLVQFSQKAQELEKKQRDERLQARLKTFVTRKQLPKGTKVSDAFLQKYNSYLSPQRRKAIYKNFIDKSEFCYQHEKLLCFEIQRAINKQASQEKLGKSNAIQAELNKKALQGDGASIVLKVLQGELKDGKVEVVFTPKRDDTTEITMKSIISHYFSNRFVIKQTFQQDDNLQFQKIYKSYQQFQKFCSFLKKKYHRRYGLSQQSIVIHSIEKGSIIVESSSSQIDKLVDNVLNLDRRVEILPFFRYLYLSPDYFDAKGNIKFRDSYSKIQFRGNWPYYQPIKCTRYGLKVSKQFDNGSDDWLMMKNLPGEWAVGFHGVKNPNKELKDAINVINSILSGLLKPEKHCIKPQSKDVGGMHAHQNNFCINPPFQGEKVGLGVYLTPHLQVALGYSKYVQFQSEKYHIVLQCRLNPKKIKICRRKDHKKEDKEDYWVINQSQDIRPYGIILVNNKDKIAYPKSQIQFNQTFKYQKYRSRIQESLKPRPAQP